MAKININQQNLEALVAPALAAAEKEINRISQTHAGRPANEVEAALAAAMRKHGIEPGRDLQQIAEQISNDAPI